jgi:hypothetical protein
MSELTDLEKLKQDVENLKMYLINDAGMLNTIYEENVGLDWDVCRENLAIYYAVLYRTQNDLFRGIDNEYYNKFRQDCCSIDNIRKLPKIMREDRRREMRENFMMKQQDISVSKGGKTRKNRKPRK